MQECQSQSQYFQLVLAAAPPVSGVPPLRRVPGVGQEHVLRVAVASPVGLGGVEVMVGSEGWM